MMGLVSYLFYFDKGSRLYIFTIISFELPKQFNILLM